MLLVILLVMFGSLGLGFLAARKGLSGTTGVQPNWRGLIWAALAAIVVLILYFILKPYGQNIFHADTPAGAVFWAALCLLLAVGYVLQYRQPSRAGAVLLDLGHPRRIFFFSLAGVVAVSALITFFTAPGHGLWQGACYLTIAAGFLAQAFSPMQLKEGGIATGNGFLPWHKIKSFSWKQPATLTISTTGPLPWTNQFELKVPHDQVEAVDRIFQLYIPPAQAT